MQGSLEPLLSSEGGSSVESLSLVRSDPSLLSDWLALGRSDPSPLSLGLPESDVEPLLSDGGLLSLPDESPTLGSSLSLGRSLSEPSEVQPLSDRDVDWESEPLDDVGTLVEWSLSEVDVLVDPEPESDPLLLPEFDPLPLVDPDSLLLPEPESLSEYEADPLTEWLRDSELSSTLGSLVESLVEVLADGDVESDSLESEAEPLSLLVEESKLYDGDPPEPESLRDSLSDSLESEPLDSDWDDSLPDDALPDDALADDALADSDSDSDVELLSDGVLTDSLDSDSDESLDDADPLESDSDDPLDEETPDAELELDRLDRLAEVLESLDSLPEDSLDCELEELADVPLDADDKLSELDELLPLSRLVEVLELLDWLLPDDSLD